MAYGVISRPGTVTGPCIGPCEHLDCAENRSTAETTCHACGEPIGYGTKYTVWGSGHGHLECALDFSARDLKGREGEP